MNITKQNIGEKIYFIDKAIDSSVFVVEYGRIFSVIPKFGFQDRYSQDYSREENIMISTTTRNGMVTKVLTNQNLAFKSLEEVYQYCGSTTEVVYGYSVLEARNDA